MTTHSINIYDLYSEFNKKNMRKLEVFDKALLMCHNRIKDSVTYGKLTILYEVPHFIIGMPVFDHNKCIAFVIRKLRDDGFHVKYYFPNVLYVSWKIADINLRNKESLMHEFYDLHPLELETMPPSSRPERTSTSNPLSKIDSILTIRGPSVNDAPVKQKQTRSKVSVKPSAKESPLVNHQPPLIPDARHDTLQSFSTNLKPSFVTPYSFKPSGKFVLHI
jgi:hypothetical protein